MKMKLTVLAVLMAVTPQTRATINRPLRPDDFEVVWAADASETEEAPSAQDADTKAAIAAAEKFRESLLARRDAPLALGPYYRHWGINE